MHLSPTICVMNMHVAYSLSLKLLDWISWTAVLAARVLRDVGTSCKHSAGYPLPHNGAAACTQTCHQHAGIDLCARRETRAGGHVDALEHCLLKGAHVSPEGRWRCANGIAGDLSSLNLDLIFLVGNHSSWYLPVIKHLLHLQ